MRNLADAWLSTAPIAHRGLHDHARGIPENSLPAFDAAIAAGYPIELDVQQLGDGSLVVFHDDDLRRATGVDRALSSVTRAEIADHRLFGTEARVPSLSEALTQIAGRVPIMLEIKQRGRDVSIAAEVQREIARYAGPLVVQSFNPFVMAWFRRHAGERALGQLAGVLERESWLTRHASRRLVTAALSRPDFVNFELRGLPDAWVEFVVRQFKLPLVCWTVRDEQGRKQAERLGINYVFENIRP
jgi:glycerophosphoryl diester phosphodiesterase